MGTLPKGYRSLARLILSLLHTAAFKYLKILKYSNIIASTALAVGYMNLLCSLGQYSCHRKKSSFT